VRPDWEDFRIVVEQLRTPEGCQAMYAANPGLLRPGPRKPPSWRLPPVGTGVVSAPDLTLDVLEHGGLQINRDFSGQVRVGWSPRSGRAV